MRSLPGAKSCTQFFQKTYVLLGSFEIFGDKIKGCDARGWRVVFAHSQRCTEDDF